MRSTLVSLFVLAGFTGHVLAGVFITSPTGTSSATGGQVLNIVWNDDTKPPSLAQVGPCEVGIYVGSVNVQTEVQQLSALIDVSKQTSFNATVNSDIGPNDNFYFVRFASIALTDNSTGFPYESFSAKFTLAGMSGELSPAALALVSAAASNGTVASSTPAPTATSSGNSTSKPLSITNTASNASKTASSSATPSKSNAAVLTQSNIGLLGVVMGLAGILL